jgi:hypothetical protein
MKAAHLAGDSAEMLVARTVDEKADARVVQTVASMVDL